MISSEHFYLLIIIVFTKLYGFKYTHIKLMIFTQMDLNNR